eukprot:COSAG01_NODE_16769_length_1206_cov_1.967480_2_plen_110_part_00
MRRVWGISDQLAAAIAEGVTCWNPVHLTCVDCALATGRFCDGDEVMGADGRSDRVSVSLGDPCHYLRYIYIKNAAMSGAPPPLVTVQEFMDVRYYTEGSIVDWFLQQTE